MTKLAEAVGYLNKHYLEPMLWDALYRRGLVPKNQAEKEALVKVAKAAGLALAIMDHNNRQAFEKTASQVAASDPNVLNAIVTILKSGLYDNGQQT